MNDPYEDRNRKIHDFNKTLDQKILAPVSGGYGGGLPGPVRSGVTNFAENVELPGLIVNDVLQFNLEDAAWNTGRFLVNTVFGFGGLLDPADHWGQYERDTDFGETLHVWGVPEGAYLELPFVGPSTQRDAVGEVVDMFTNPLSYVLDRRVMVGARIAGGGDVLQDRFAFDETYDSLLYGSADSYAQTRLAYLQNRRFELGQTVGSAGDDDSFDPYAAEFGIDPYAID